jgi:hypothetical protein
MLVLRICLHAVIVYQGFVSDADIVIRVLLSLTLLMHVVWFHGWVVGQGAKLLGFKKTDKGDAKVVASDGGAVRAGSPPPTTGATSPTPLSPPQAPAAVKKGQ